MIHLTSPDCKHQKLKFFYFSFLPKTADFFFSALFVTFGSFPHFSPHFAKYYVNNKLFGFPFQIALYLSAFPPLLYKNSYTGNLCCSEWHAAHTFLHKADDSAPESSAGNRRIRGTVFSTVPLSKWIVDFQAVLTLPAASAES